MAAAFTYTQTKANIPIGGGFSISYGTYTSSGGATGGDILTGASNVVILIGVPDTTAQEFGVSAYTGGTVTIVTEANQTGRWLSVQRG